MLFFTFESKKTTVKYRKSFLRCSRHRGIDIKRWICSIGAIVEGKGFYAAIIVENRNPLLESIIDDFERTSEALTTGKP